MFGWLEKKARDFIGREGTRDAVMGIGWSGNNSRFRDRSGIRESAPADSPAD